MTRTFTLGLAAIALAALNQGAVAHSCLPQHHAYFRNVHYERAHVSHHRGDVRYVVVERPRYRTIYEDVYEPVPVYAPHWSYGPYERDWGYTEGPILSAGYYGDW